MENSIKDKIILIGLTTLLISLGVFVFLYLNEKSARIEAENRSDNNEKEYLRSLRDSLQNMFEYKILEFQIEVKKISKLEEEIKYIPYEKVVYPDRNLDDALIILSEHKNNTSSKREN